MNSLSPFKYLKENSLSLFSGGQQPVFINSEEIYKIINSMEDGHPNAQKQIREFVFRMKTKSDDLNPMEPAKRGKIDKNTTIKFTASYMNKPNVQLKLKFGKNLKSTQVSAGVSINLFNTAFY